MTVLSSPRRLYLVLMPQNRNQRVISAVTSGSLVLLEEDYWYVKHYICKLHKLN